MKIIIQTRAAEAEIEAAKIAGRNEEIDRVTDLIAERDYMPGGKVAFVPAAVLRQGVVIVASQGGTNFHASHIVTYVGGETRNGEGVAGDMWVEAEPLPGAVGGSYGHAFKLTDRVLVDGTTL